MLEIVAQIVLTISLGGIVLLVARKIPLLVVLSQTAEEERKGLFKKGRKDNKGKFKPYSAKELEEKTARPLFQDKSREIDADGDYWQNIKNSE